MESTSVFFMAHINWFAGFLPSTACPLCQEFGDESLHPGDLKPSLAKAMNEVWGTVTQVTGWFLGDEFFGGPSEI